MLAQRLGEREARRRVRHLRAIQSCSDSRSDTPTVKFSLGLERRNGKSQCLSYCLRSLKCFWRFPLKLRLNLRQSSLARSFGAESQRCLIHQTSLFLAFYFARIAFTRSCATKIR